MPSDPCPNPGCDAGRVNITVETRENWPERVNSSLKEGGFVVRMYCAATGQVLTITRYQNCPKCGGTGKDIWSSAKWSSGSATRLSQVERARKTMG